MDPQYFAEEIIRMVLAAVIFGFPLWKIFKKAGFNPWWMLMLFIPPFGVGTFLIMLFLALRKWPATELEKY